MRLQIRESQRLRQKWMQRRSNDFIDIESDMANYKPKAGKVEEKVVNAYKKIENGVVGGYQAKHRSMQNRKVKYMG